MNNGRRKNTTFKLLPTPALQSGNNGLPPHLTNTTWVNHEKATVSAAFHDLKRDLKELKDKVSSKRVHVARVTLRRWFSVWKVLRRDGWESEKYKETTGRTLKKLQKLLGALRDIDVNLDHAERFSVSAGTIELWQEERHKQSRKLEKFVEQANFQKLLKRLDKYIQRRWEKLETTLPRAKANQSAYNHLELYLREQEITVKDAAETAHSPEQYHQLRLAIKSWRYLLTEFFGLTNLELVAAQQLLGHLHDIDRLTPLLSQNPAEKAASHKLNQLRGELLQEIDKLRRRLPYGLRPQVTSTKKS